MENIERDKFAEPIADLIGHLERMNLGNWALTAGGSTSKGTSDHLSDLDLRLYHETPLPWPSVTDPVWREYVQAEDSWRLRGYMIDPISPRPFKDVEAELDRLIAGEMLRPDMVWTLWGYRLLPDIANQVAFYDNTGTIARWKDKIAVFPAKLKRAILDHHLGSIEYWRTDYHYRNKVERGDAVFLAGLSSKLTHSLLEILFAVNEVYFPGDGNNLKLASTFQIAPADFVSRVESALYPSAGEDKFTRQYRTLMELINDVAPTAKTHLQLLD